MKGQFNGQALRQARTAKGWSRGDVVAGLLDLEERLATQNHLGVDPSLVAKWEGGRRRPNLFYAVRLCLLFQLPAERLGLMHLQGRPRFDITLAHLQHGLEVASDVGRPPGGELAGQEGMITPDPVSFERFLGQLTRQMAEEPALILFPFASEYLRLINNESPCTLTLALRAKEQLRAFMGQLKVLLDRTSYLDRDRDDFSQS
jgi:transcriptional regulator with XRE-family HTH domain